MVPAARSGGAQNQLAQKTAGVGGRVAGPDVSKPKKAQALAAPAYGGFGTNDSA